MIVALLFGSFALLLILRVPIGISLGMSSLVTIFASGVVQPTYLAQGLVTGADSFSLMAVPFFVLAGELMATGGISRRLLNIADAFLGRKYGGLALVTVVACMFFAAISGSGPATVAAIGGLTIPSMLKQGYDRPFAGAISAAAGSIGVIIPPSIPMIVYGAAVGVSVTGLFAAGVIPGILMGASLVIYNKYVSKKRGYVGDTTAVIRKSAVWKNAIWAVIMPVIVLGGMGLKYDDYLFFRDTLEKSGAMGRTVMFIHTASDPTVECTLVPDMALAVAEQFALSGKRVLVLLTDMTNYADAQKEMAITMEQVPSNRGYPGDLYSCLASRYEKAVDFGDAGSITILAVTTMPGDDVTHPVPDNTGYITEGQYYLKNGHIEPFGSLSRLKQNVNDKTRSDHRALMDGMIRLYSAYKESLEKKSMGFMMSEWDEKLLKYGHLFETKLMDLSVNIPLEEALDLGWEILAECFEPNETGLKTSLIQERWPKPATAE